MQLLFSACKRSWLALRAPGPRSMTSLASAVRTRLALVVSSAVTAFTTYDTVGTVGTYRRYGLRYRMYLGTSFVSILQCTYLLFLRPYYSAGFSNGYILSMELLLALYHSSGKGIDLTTC